MRAAPARGMTLVELTIAMFLAALLVGALSSFYVSTQALWTDGSSQALTQRDGTFLVSVITDSTRVARRAVVSAFPDAQHETLTLYSDAGATVAFRCFYWSSRDSLVYMGADQPAAGDQPVTFSRVSRFELSTTGSGLVLLDLLELPLSDGRPLRLSSAAALYNR